MSRDNVMKDPLFSSTWEEFDTTRHQMMQRSKHVWDKVDSDMKQFDKSVGKMQSDLHDETAPHRPSIPDWAVPDDMKEAWRPMISHQTDKESLVKLTDDQWEVSLDVSQYKPEDLKV